MKIESTSLALQATHNSLIRDESQESLRMWRGNQRPDFERGARSSGSGQLMARQSLISISQAAQAALSMEISRATAQSAAAQSTAMPVSGEAQAIADSADAIDNDPILSLLRLMVETMTGQPVKVFSASDLNNHQAPPQIEAPKHSTPSNSSATQAQPERRAGYGVEYDYHAVHEEIETTNFAAEGVIRTQDGQEISFKLELSMTRFYREETTISIRQGDAVRKDPLVLNFNGNVAQLTDQRFKFDLQGDGQAENLAMLTSGSGYLALDRNNNGRIDSGRELFGPATNSGFGELAALDTDGNGWIDENDASFSLLKVWQPAADGSGDGESGGELRSLKERGVGAISVANLATPFELRGTGNSNLGAIAASGVFLTDDGHVGSVQEIDLTV
jgi:hypothetical protein